MSGQHIDKLNRSIKNLLLRHNGHQTLLDQLKNRLKDLEDNNNELESVNEDSWWGWIWKTLFSRRSTKLQDLINNIKKTTTDFLEEFKPVKEHLENISKIRTDLQEAQKTLEEVGKLRGLDCDLTKNSIKSFTEKVSGAITQIEKTLKIIETTKSPN